MLMLPVPLNVPEKKRLQLRQLLKQRPTPGTHSKAPSRAEVDIGREVRAAGRGELVDEGVRLDAAQREPMSVNLWPPQVLRRRRRRRRAPRPTLPSRALSARSHQDPGCCAVGQPHLLSLLCHLTETVKR